MSIFWLNKVFEESVQTDPRPLLTLLVIADFSNREGYCWPGLDSIAEKTRQSKRNITRILPDLEKTGELYINRVSGKGNSYLMCIGSEAHELTHALERFMKMKTEDAFTVAQKILKKQMSYRTYIQGLDGSSIGPRTARLGPRTDLSTDPSINHLYNKGVEPGQKFDNIRSSETYIELQNAIITVCKKVELLTLTEKEIENIDILYEIGAKPSEIRTLYGKDNQDGLGPTSWWFTQFWKGKKGQFPTPADIRSTLGQAREHRPDDVQNDGEAAQAWAEVMAWLNGKKAVADFSHEQTLLAIREIGEYKLRHRRKDETPFLRQQFIDIFQET
jgi:hypothetical protein